jgi:hypothetical protein
MRHDGKHAEQRVAGQEGRQHQQNFHQSQYRNDIDSAGVFCQPDYFHCLQDTQHGDQKHAGVTH